MRNLAILVIACLFAITSTAQKVNFKGNISANEGNTKVNVSFAAIVVSLASDSANIVAQTISDTNGNYAFKGINTGNYKIFISSLGYKTVSETIKVTTPPFGDAFVKDFMLSTNVHHIESVDVVAQSKHQHIDKTNYIITKEDLKVSTHSVDLLQKIPKLTFSPVTQKLSAQSGNVKVLVNGAGATELDLLALDANLVKNIECYDFPPARYAGYSYVINVITKEQLKGFSGSINLQHALTTTFGNDNIFVKYNLGKNQISLSGATYIRGYNEVWNNDSYKFNFDGKQYSRTATSKTPFGYDDNYITLQYTRNVEDKYMFQAKFSPNFMNSYGSSKGDIMQTIDNITNERTSTTKRNSQQFTPTIDLYSNIYLPNNQELMLNLTSTFFDANSYEYINELDAQTQTQVLFDEMHQQNNKISHIVDAEYSKELSMGANIAIGNKLSYGKLNSTVDNSLSSGEYFTNQASNYTYAEFTGSIASIMYRATLGANYYTNSNNTTSYNKLTFEPKLMLGYKINSKNNIRAVYQRASTNPTLSELSPNKLLISEGIVRAGNPLLETNTVDILALNYSNKQSWVEFDLSAGYINNSKPINSYFVEEEDYINLRYENADRSEVIGGSASASFIPFKNRLLVIKASGEIEKQTINSSLIGKYSYVGYGLNYEATINHKNFSLSYQGNTPMWYLDGPYINLGEKQSNLVARYKLNDFTFSVNCYWFLSSALYQKQTINTSLVDYDYTRHIHDNDSMITLGISWRFSSGKAYKSGSRNRNNSDTDSGLF